MNKMEEVPLMSYCKMLVLTKRKLTYLVVCNHWPLDKGEVAVHYFHYAEK